MPVALAMSLPYGAGHWNGAESSASTTDHKACDERGKRVPLTRVPAAAGPKSPRDGILGVRLEITTRFAKVADSHVKLRRAFGLTKR